MAGLGLKPKTCLSTQTFICTSRLALAGTHSFPFVVRLAGLTDNCGGAANRPLGRCPATPGLVGRSRGRVEVDRLLDCPEGRQRLLHANPVLLESVLHDHDCTPYIFVGNGDTFNHLLQVLQIFHQRAAHSPSLAQQAAQACHLQGHVQGQDGLHHVAEVFVGILAEGLQHQNERGVTPGGLRWVQQWQQPLVGVAVEASDDSTAAIHTTPAHRSFEAPLQLPG
mmetsp:Transcript_73150/g.210029  ORF Transcript_73150/g.210029 Transcript_73150/m.210029 type:complete len:224 (+) Transcript_73150:237-908(+)